MRIASGGMSWIFTSFFLVFLLLGCSFFVTGWLMWSVMTLSVVSFLLSCILIVFFRDPERSIGFGIVAVADGKIRGIHSLQDIDVGYCIRISTFMNIHNVHVNRMPFDGTIQCLIHHDGSHVPAFKKESDSNERVVLLLNTNLGVMKIVQIAGTVARRIVPYVSEGEFVKKGERIGLIRLGSRVDLYLPVDTITTIRIRTNEKVKAGENSLAEIHG